MSLPIFHLPAEFSPDATGVVVVDHGSRRAESNDLLLAVVEAFRQRGPWRIVEPAHMELAEPSLATAMAACVRQGAKTVAVFPYFLGPGRHWSEDIPRLAALAAAAHPGLRYVVTAPLGLDPLLLEVMQQRIAQCLARVAGEGEPCDLCRPSPACRLL